jgi:molecular chaperone DnaJ
VTINLKPHAIFQRDGSHLLCEVPISIVIASLGGELEVPTLDGRVVLKIPEGAQTGRTFRLRGKGVKSVRGGTIGDMLCKLVVETPVKLSRDQKELLKEFGENMGSQAGRHSPKESSWLDGVKKFFDDMKL